MKQNYHGPIIGTEDTILSRRKEGAAQLLGQDSGISWEPR